MLPVFSSFQLPNLVSDGTVEVFTFLNAAGDILLDERKNEMHMILQKIKFILDSRISNGSGDSGGSKVLSQYINQRLSIDPQMKARLERRQLNATVCDAIANQKEFRKRNKFIDVIDEFICINFI